MICDTDSMKISSAPRELGARAFVRETAVATFWGAAGRVGGMLVPFCLAAWYGVSRDTDALFFSFGLLVAVANVFASGLEAAIVPFAVGARAGSARGGARFAGRLFVVVLLGLAVAAAVAGLAAAWGLPRLTRMDPEGARLAARLFALGLPVIAVWGATSVLVAVLNSAHRYALAAASPVVRAACVIGAAWLGRATGDVRAVVVGLVVGEALRAACLAVQARRLGLLEIPRGRLLDPAVRRALQAGGWLVLGLGILTVNFIVDRAMASALGVGAISVLDYAEKAYAVPVAVLVFGFLNVVLSHWSNTLETPAAGKVRGQVVRTVAAVGLAAAVAGALGWFLREPLIGLAFAHGAFPAAAVANTSRVFGVYCLGLAPFLAGLAFTRYYMARRRTDLLAALAVVQTTVHVILNIAWIPVWGLAGIAASSGVAYAIVTVLLWAHFRAVEARAA